VHDAAGALVEPEVVARFPEWLESLPQGAIEFVSTDFTPFHSALTAPTARLVSSVASRDRQGAVGMAIDGRPKGLFRPCP
jgi:hypothetical protein